MSVGMVEVVCVGVKTGEDDDNSDGRGIGAIFVIMGFFAWLEVLTFGNGV